MPRRTYRESPMDTVATRVRNARAVIVAMMNTFDDDLTETAIPTAWMHEGLEAIKELLDDADDALFKDFEAREAKRKPSR